MSEIESREFAIAFALRNEREDPGHIVVDNSAVHLGIKITSAARELLPLKSSSEALSQGSSSFLIS